MIRAGLVVLALAASAPARAAAPHPAATIDPRLAAAVASGADSVATVWVELIDKGERGAGDRARRLALAEVLLTSRNRARRIRAGVTPLVDVRDLPVEPAYLDALRARGLEPFAVSRWLNRAAVRVPLARVSELAALPCVARLEPVARVASRQVPPPDAKQRSLASETAAPAARRLAAVDYGRTLAELQQIGVPALHDSGYTGQGVLVAILDAGFADFDVHQATRGMNVPPGHRRDFASGDTLVSEPGSSAHGLWVAANLGGNRPGQFVGPAFGAAFALARTEVENTERRVEMLYWGQAAEWADSLGADLISSSLGYNTFDPTEEDYTYPDMDGRTTDISRSAEIAAAKGILVVNAVGNEGQTPWRHLLAPADVHGDSLIAVGSVDAGGQLSPSSSLGPTADGRIKPDLVARGVNVLVPQPGDSTAYMTQSGTSLSTPLVAGLAACLFQARPSWTPQQLIRALRETASNAVHPDNAHGYGLPNGGRALRWDPTGLKGQDVLAIELLGPNPRRDGGPPTFVRFALGASADPDLSARLDVFDALGRHVRSLWSGRLVQGETRTAGWEGDDDSGTRVRAGIYWIAVTSGRNAASVRVAAL